MLAEYSGDLQWLLDRLCYAMRGIDLEIMFQKPILCSSDEMDDCKVYIKLMNKLKHIEEFVYLKGSLLKMGNVIDKS